MYQSIRGDRFPQYAGGVELLVGTGKASHHNHGDMTRVRVRGNLLAHSHAAQERQPEIEDHGFWRIAVEDPQRIETVSGLERLIARKCQRRSKHPT